MEVISRLIRSRRKAGSYACKHPEIEIIRMDAELFVRCNRCLQEWS